MRRLAALALAFALAHPIFAQTYVAGGPGNVPVLSDPAGPCVTGQPNQTNVTNGKVWYCQGSAFSLAGTWTQASGGSATLGTTQTTQITNQTSNSGYCGNLTPFNGSSLTLTLQSPPIANCPFAIINLNTGSTLTIARNGLTINGQSSNFTVSACSGVSCNIVSIWNDGTNYFVGVGQQGAAGGAGTLAITSITNVAVVNGTPVFVGLGGTGINTAENIRVTPMARAGTLGPGAYLYINATQSAAGALVCTWRTGSTFAALADTSMVITVAANAASGVYSDTTHSFSFNAGDLVDIRCQQNTSGTSAPIVGISNVLF